ncbi:MAG: HAMP domain-containing protein [Lachnospiraceae bacterium]|nr:HAMP domain-containing protein [Lachnospiraceae bacterium]
MKNKKISVQLMRVLVPMIALFIVAVACIIFINSKEVITREGKESLQIETEANANSISRTMQDIKGYYNALGDSFETTKMDDAAIKVALQPGMKEYPEMVNDVYVAFTDKIFIDGGDWVPPTDYDPTTRGWFQEGMTSDTIIIGTPDIDMDTKQAVVNGIRKVQFADGRTGVLSTDIFLKNIANAVSEYTPLDTGKSYLFAGSQIIGSPTEEYVGADATEPTSDEFLQEIYSKVSSNSVGETYTITGNDDKEYFVALKNVEGTNWTLVSYVKKSDVLKNLSDLLVITVILVAIMLIVSTIVIILLVRKMITKPVNNLTSTISKISEGDFTVSIVRGGNNEIGLMNNKMFEYVERMRTTLGEMKEVTNAIVLEADKSMQAADFMSNQADAQSESMEQIRIAMNGISQSVTELATDATELAHSVSDMNQQGVEAKELMNEVLIKAKKGQEDMNVVQKNMKTISVSMSEMSDVVEAVDVSAQKINTIVEMINSISSQTNLLSLNASIEAARAGEAGKGFAVVATEIGNLAMDSANATTEISSIIRDITEQIKTLSSRSSSSMEEIENSSASVSETGQTFENIFIALDNAGNTVNDMVNKMNRVNEVAMSVAAISQEQSASAEEVTATVDSAADSARGVADESRNVDHSASTVSETAARIGEFVETFTI